MFFQIVRKHGRKPVIMCCPGTWRASVCTGEGGSGKGVAEVDF